MTPSKQPALARFVVVPLSAAALVGASAWIAPSCALEARPAFVLAYASVALEILLLALFAPALGPRALALSLLAPLLLLGALVGAPSSPSSAALLSLALGALSALLGAALGARLEKPGQLAAVALVSSIADLWSVLDPAAPSARLAAQVAAHPDELTLFALPFPLLGTDAIPALIGAGDVLFAALYVAAFRGHGLHIGRAASALALGFAAGLAGLLVLERPLPLLPLLGGAVLLAEPAARSLSKREWRTVLLACVALLGAIALHVSR